MTRVAVLAVLLGLAAALAGCGPGAGTGSGDVQMLVTRDFGTRAVGEVPPGATRGSETVMRYVQRHFDVTTRYGGGFVQSIGGLAGGRRHGAPYDWFFYVNGVESERGAAAVAVQPGDRVWWDYHDWGATMQVPAVVGAYPEPFVHGPGDGKRLPVRVECPQAPADQPVCQAVADRLDRAGVLAAQAAFETVGGDQTLRVIVGPWSQVSSDLAAKLIERGPQSSGVYARFAGGGRTLQALAPDGHVARTLGPGTGLIAATRFADQQPTWFVTGTDLAGVRQALKAFDQASLANRFALAVHADQGIPLPITTPAR